MSKVLTIIITFFLISSSSVDAKNSISIFLSQQDSTSTKEVLYDTDTVVHSPIDEEQIKKYQKDPDFNYQETLPEDNWWTRVKQWLRDVWSSFIRWILGTNPATGFWATLVKILPYILVIGLLILLVWVFLKIDNGQLLFEKKSEPQAFMADDDELIHHEDLQALIREALDKKNFRLAIRFYYLLVLQKLSNAELINWQVQKTNHDYIYEIQDTRLRNDFRTVTDIYDYSWYGNFDVDISTFTKAETVFKMLNNKI